LEQAANRGKRRGAVAVVLPGGGARGAYQVGVLKALAELLPAGAEPFSIVTGTSAGAVNAAVLASRVGQFSTAVERLEHFWSGLQCDAIYRTGPLSVLGASLRLLLSAATAGLLPVAPRALLDNKPLRELLDAALQLERLGPAIEEQRLRGVAVTASAYTRSSAVSFYQGSEAIKPWTRSRRSGEPVTLSVDHIMASLALPLLFPAQRIGKEYYGDGGLRSGAPLSPAIHLGADRLLVIATRDEKPDPAPQVATRYPGAGEIAGYLLDTIFMDTLNADLARLHRINQTLEAIPVTQGAEGTERALRPIASFVVRPGRDLRDLTAAHADAMPWSVKLLLRILGAWGKDWRMASYLLFAGSYTRALIELGYDDGMRQAEALKAFLAGDG